MKKPRIRWKRWMYPVFQRRVFVFTAVLVQFALLFYMFWTGITTVRWLYLALTLVSGAAVIVIIARRKETVYKLPWVILIALMPAFGGILFLIIHGQASQKKFARRLEEVDALLSPYFSQDPDTAARFAGTERGSLQRVRYLSRHNFPLYDAADTLFFPSGEEMFRRLCEELEKAEHFIFFEFFIIADGEMWDRVHEILRRKAAEGVEVRVVYDDLGCLLRLPHRYDLTLEAEGIKAILFNPFRPVVSTVQNNRDHRKIVVVDGRVAFTGGVNIGDEYINRVERYGHWNDTALMVTGDAVRAFTGIFLQLWLCSRPEDEGDLARFFPPCTPAAPDEPRRGFVQPYGDTPLDGETVGAWVYDQILRTATDYVWITTPYLIVDDTLCNSLMLAAKSGVDVRIVTPGIPDKKIVSTVSRSYYLALLEAGVRIYEYTPGFLHAKMFLSDDRTATVGTINLDYRSLYLHFECGAWMTDTEAVPRIKDYFTALFPMCREITEEEMRRNYFLRFIGALLQPFAPFL